LEPNYYENHTIRDTQFMIKYILKRLWHSGILAIVMSLIVFFGLYVVGDPVEMLADDEFTEQDKID